MKNEEWGQEKFDFIEKLISELHEMQDLKGTGKISKWSIKRDVAANSHGGGDSQNSDFS